jgi:hypothetical protein
VRIGKMVSNAAGKIEDVNNANKRWQKQDGIDERPYRGKNFQQ